MKKFILLKISLLLTIFIAQASFAGPVYERIKAKGEINCGYAEWPKFFDVDPNNGEFSGFFYDFWRMIGDELDVKINWSVPLQWGQVTEAVSTRKIDIFCNGVWPDGGRRKNMLLVDPVVYTPLYAYVRIDDDRFTGKSLASLNKAEIRGTALDSDASETILKKYFPNAQRTMLSASSSFSDMILSVATSKSDFVVVDVPEVDAYIANNPDKITQLSDEPVVLKQVQIPLAIGEEHLLNSLNGIIRDFANDGTIATLVKKHGINGVLLPQYNYSE